MVENENYNKTQGQSFLNYCMKKMPEKKWVERNFTDGTTVDSHNPIQVLIR